MMKNNLSFNVRAKIHTNRPQTKLGFLYHKKLKTFIKIYIFQIHQ